VCCAIFVRHYLELSYDTKSRTVVLWLTAARAEGIGFCANVCCGFVQLGVCCKLEM
jgi:hypothetical protein